MLSPVPPARASGGGIAAAAQRRQRGSTWWLWLLLGVFALAAVAYTLVYIGLQRDWNSGAFGWHGTVTAAGGGHGGDTDTLVDTAGDGGGGGSVVVDSTRPAASDDVYHAPGINVAYTLRELSPADAAAAAAASDITLSDPAMSVPVPPADGGGGDNGLPVADFDDVGTVLLPSPLLVPDKDPSVRFAVVSIMYGNDTYLRYTHDACVLAQEVHSLHRRSSDSDGDSDDDDGGGGGGGGGADVDFIVLHTAELNERARRIFTTLNAPGGVCPLHALEVAVPVRVADVRNAEYRRMFVAGDDSYRSYTGISWNEWLKLLAWRLTQYDRVLIVDLDVSVYTPLTDVNQVFGRRVQAAADLTAGRNVPPGRKRVRAHGEVAPHRRLPAVPRQFPEEMALDIVPSHDDGERRTAGAAATVAVDGPADGSRVVVRYGQRDALRRRVAIPPIMQALNVSPLSGCRASVCGAPGSKTPMNGGVVYLEPSLAVYAHMLAHLRRGAYDLRLGWHELLPDTMLVELGISGSATVQGFVYAHALYTDTYGEFNSCVYNFRKKVPPGTYAECLYDDARPPRVVHFTSTVCVKPWLVGYMEGGAARWRNHRPYGKGHPHPGVAHAQHPWCSDAQHRWLARYERLIAALHERP